MLNIAALIFTLSALASPTLAQSWVNASYFGLATYPCATSSWFDTISQSPTAPGMLIPNVDLSDCRVQCWLADYKWSFYRALTDDCYCSYTENLPANQIATSNDLYEFCQSGDHVMLSDLVATYHGDGCTTKRRGVTTPATTTNTVKACIQRCGKAPSETDAFRTSYVTPQYDTTLGVWNYKCECAKVDPQVISSPTTCGPTKTHVYRWDWDWQE